jgi:hypothetical protein
VPDVVGLYRRFGVRLPDIKTQGWVTVRCFAGSHEDRHASARVDVRSGGFKCFTCGAFGGMLDALQLLGVRDRDEARQLAVDYGILEAPRRRRSEGGPATPRPVRPAGIRPPNTARAERVDYDRLGDAPAILRERTWPYVDANGTPVGRVRRRDLADGRKQLWQERPNGAGWLPGLEGAQLPLYGLPLVLAAARQHRPVVVVEGEKAVDALERIGLLATTNAGGAGKWRDDHTAALAGAVVTVIADSDLPGRLHAIDVTARCAAAGVEARMPLDLGPLRQDGFDVVDHLAGVAATSKTVNPELPAAELRQNLRRNLEREMGRCLPVDPDALRVLTERARHGADPAGLELRHCERRGYERPHHISHGLAYCPYGKRSPA